jgi:streptomycin 6-kinase
MASYQGYGIQQRWYRNACNRSSVVTKARTEEQRKQPSRWGSNILRSWTGHGLASRLRDTAALVLQVRSACNQSSVVTKTRTEEQRKQPSRWGQ